MITLFIINLMFKMICWCMYYGIMLAAVIIDFCINFVFGFITSFITSFISEYKKAKTERYKQTIAAHEEIRLLSVSKYQ